MTTKRQQAINEVKALRQKLEKEKEQTIHSNGNEKKFDIIITYEKIKEFEDIAQKNIPPYWSNLFVSFLNTCEKKRTAINVSTSI